MNPRSDEELKARRQARRSERGQRLLFMFGALLTIAALGVGAAVLLEARAVPAVASDLEHGVVTIAAPSLTGTSASGITSLSNDARRRLRADLVLDASTGRGSSEISVRRIGGTEIAIVQPAKKAPGKKGLRAARELVRTASGDADLVVVVLDGSSRPVGAVKAKNRARFAHAMIDAGGDLVVIRGKAVVSGLEWYRDRLIAYGLTGDIGEAGETSATDGINRVLRITLTTAGSWVDGNVLTLDAEGSTGAVPDNAVDAFRLLRDQSRTHFGSSAVRVERSGSLRPPTSEQA